MGAAVLVSSTRRSLIHLRESRHDLIFWVLLGSALAD
jgi:hypothetical protein